MKYKVGDRVRIKSLDWYNENKNKIGFICFDYANFIPEMSRYCGEILTINQIVEECKQYLVSECAFSWTDEMIEGLVEEESKKEVIAWMPNGKIVAEKFNDGTITTFIDKFKYNKLPINSEFCDDKVELVISHDFELKQEGDKWFAIKKKKSYPKTYEECCKVLCCKPIFGFAGLDDDEENLYVKFIALKRCRNAYWKIAGEEMGLGKPWKPRWNDSYQKKWIINFYQDEINLTNGPNVHFVLAFPTEEMRDAFYENFKELIEECKELL